MRQLPPEAEGDTNRTNQRFEWQKHNIDGNTQQLLDRDSAAFLHQSVSTPCLTAIRKASGAWIEDTTGRRYLDFHGNSVHHIGYGHPKMLHALKQQIDELTFAPRRFTCEPAIQLAEKLVSLAPFENGKVLFAPSGSDAIEVAVAYARAATGRYKTLSFWDSYHGTGFAARSLSGESMFRSGPIGPLMPGTEHVPPFGDYRNAWGVEEGSGDLCAKYIRYVLEKEGDVAALVAEPMRAVPYVAPPGFWKKVRTACDQFGTLLIFDEIPTCLGKTGSMFACQNEDVIPDILVLGKSLGGGAIPLAAVVCRDELNIASEYAFGHYTHEKNPLSARAGLTTIQIIEEENLVSRARALGEIGLLRLREMMGRFEEIGDVRGRGCLFGAELVKDRTTKSRAFDLSQAVLYECLSRGLSFKVTMGNVLTFGPPLILADSEMHHAMDIVEQAIEDCLAKSKHSVY